MKEISGFEPTSEGSERLMRKIRAAFNDLKVPSLAELVENFDDYHIEERDVALYFNNKKWNDITWESLRGTYPHDECACLSFMTPVSFRYYLPCYMMFSLAIADERLRMTIAGCVICQLRPPASHELGDVSRFKERMDGFTSRQRNAIRFYLRFYVEGFPGQIPQLYFDVNGTMARDYWELEHGALGSSIRGGCQET